MIDKEVKYTCFVNDDMRKVRRLLIPFSLEVLKVLCLDPINTFMIQEKVIYLR